ncbi:MAG TPA: hypothetical protein VK699_02265 [Terriglobales bacterium]|nr:hypothetical protein [Terriglobales bacterium]
MLFQKIRQASMGVNLVFAAGEAVACLRICGIFCAIAGKVT